MTIMVHGEPTHEDLDGIVDDVLDALVNDEKLFIEVEDFPQLPKILSHVCFGVMAEVMDTPEEELDEWGEGESIHFIYTYPGDEETQTRTLAHAIDYAIDQMSIH